MRTYAKPANKRRQTVKQLAARGLNGDCIAQTLGLNKNTLRARHALDLHAGRRIKAAEKAAAAAAALSKNEQERLDCIRRSFNSHWYSKEHGNDLFGNTHTVEEALEWCKQYGDW